MPGKGTEYAKVLHGGAQGRRAGPGQRTELHPRAMGTAGGCEAAQGFGFWKDRSEGSRRGEGFVSMREGLKVP